jgi:uncharacterized tellurite resistance protein B-like protein
MDEEKEHKEEKKAVKGGLRTTVALILSIFALLLSVYAVNRTVSRAEINSEIKLVQKKLNVMKKELAERFDDARHETAEAVEKIGKALKKEETEQK